MKGVGVVAHAHAREGRRASRSASGASPVCLLDRVACLGGTSVMPTDRADASRQPRCPSPARAPAIAAFHASHASLQEALRTQLYAIDAVIEDAGHTAWTILLRRPDIPLDQHGSPGCAWSR